MDITVAICTTGGRRTVESAIRSVIAQQPLPHSLEILVVENSRCIGDFVRPLVQEVNRDSHLEVRWVHEPRPGLGFARNAANASATGRVIAFLDDDAIADPNWTAGLLEVFRSSGAAAVGGRVDPLWEADRPAWLTDEFLTFLGIVDYGPTPARCTFPRYPFGVNIAFDRATLNHIGGFATALAGGGKPTHEMDEIDVCRRLEAAGGQVMYAPAARVRHRVPAARLRRSFFLRRAANVARSTARMAWQTPPWPSLAGCATGEVQAALRAARHAIRALRRLTDVGGGEFVSESRHVVWNLAWMWETAILTGHALRMRFVAIPSPLPRGTSSGDG